MRRRGRVIFLLILVIALSAMGIVKWKQSSQINWSNAPLSQDVYVWQRAWKAEVVDAVQIISPHIRRPVILIAEISLKDLSVATVKPNWSAIPKTSLGVGLAIRIGSLPSSKKSSAFDEQSPELNLIVQAARSALASAKSGGVTVAELQIDFDAAESMLAGYTRWIRSLKAECSPVPVLFTALPSWLKHDEFVELARASDGFILQVHLLHRPTSPGDSMELFDPAEAREAMLSAARAQVPFRLALPTYRYLAGFSKDGKSLGLAAEGAEPDWPDNAIIRTMQSDPAAISLFLAELRQRHPESLQGVIWYRLPIATDSLNWRMPTLLAIIEGRTPQAKLDVVTQRSSSGAIDIALLNTGEADASIPARVSLRWSDADLLACDGVESFVFLDKQPGAVTFAAPDRASGQWIAPGEKLPVGWVRLSKDTEVQGHVESPGRTSSN